RSTSQPVVGLCHSVQGTSRQLAGFLSIPYEELTWRCAGINHNAWFTTLEHRGVDQYPRLRQLAKTRDVYELDPVRFEVMLHLGEREQRALDRQPARRLRGGRVQGRSGRLPSGALREAARAAGGVESRSHGCPRARRRSAARARPAEGPLRAVPRPADRGRLL